jgi:multiple sugar transport system permease protein
MPSLFHPGQWFKRKHLSITTRETLEFYLFISPIALGFLIFTLGPILASFFLSFTQYNVVKPPIWLGFKNFIDLFNDRLFWQSLKVTGMFVVMSIPLTLIGALLIALLMNQKVRGIGFFRTVFYLPSVISGVAVSLLWLWIFNPNFGLINYLLYLVGIKGPAWLFDEQWALPSIVIMSLWGVGGGMLVYLGGLQGIPTELYEAAEIDGAGRLRRFKHITLPMLSPVIFFNLIMGIIAAFQEFTPAYVMTGGGPSYATFFYNYYLYQNAFIYLQMGKASAMAWILLVIVLILTFLVFKSSPMWVFYQSQKR